MQAQMLAPAAVLVVWSILMLIWMAATRFPAIAKSGASIGEAKPGGRGQDLEGVIPDRVNWKAHNYAHLMEQPTIFYATVLIHAIMGAGAIEVTLAWIYVGLRIVHSLWQNLVNRVKIRLMIFVASTMVLMVLAIRAVIATLFFDPGAIPS